MAGPGPDRAGTVQGPEGVLRGHRPAIGSPRPLAAEFADLPFEPYAPVRQQLLNLVRYINRRREAASLEPLSFSVLRYRRRIVRPFGTVGNVAGVRQSRDRQGQRGNNFLAEVLTDGKPPLH